MSAKIRIVFDLPDSVRLDRYLADLRIQELYSRSFVERLIDEDRILVNKVPVKKSYPLQANDEIDINLPDPEPRELVPQDIPLDIVYEDNDLAIINKPSGMIVHPGFGNPDETLANAIVFHWGTNLSSGREPGRPGIVHRLDRGTSGLMMIAKHDPAQSALSEMLARREVKKTYLGVTCGVPDPPEDIIESYIARSLSNPRKMCVSDQGRWALTGYKVIRIYHYFSLVKIRLETGRMHQIRVHFAERNLPLLGDLLYNTRRQVHALVPENMKRKVTELLTTKLLHQALHSWRLQFTQPFTQQPVDVTAPPPEDFAYALGWLDRYFGIDTNPGDIESLLELQTEW
jgi:23S rRNA pseudouridine1911/1915/1917 synthase